MIAFAAALLLAAAPAGASEIERELAGIVDLFYGLDFAGSKAAADRLTAAHPGHPAGPFYQSLAAYQRFLADEEGRAESLSEFEKLSAVAVETARVWASTSAVESEYYAGAARGFRGRVFAAQRKYLRALPEALKSVRHCKKALRLDATLEDVYLGLGMYHYYRARLPAAAKPFALLLTGERADAEQGLAELRRVAERGGPARMEARSVLAAIYASDYEQRWDEAEKLLAELMERYPRNPLYRLRRVYAAERRGAFAQAAALADPDGPWIAALDAALRRSTRAAALYRAAEAALLAGRPREASARLDALAAESPSDDLKPWIARRRQELRRRHAPSEPKPWLGLEVPR